MLEVAEDVVKTHCKTCSGPPPEVPEAPRETQPPCEVSPGDSFSDSPVEMLPEASPAEASGSPAIDSE